MADLKNTSWASFAMTFCQNDFVMNMKWANCNNNNNSASESSHVEIKLFISCVRKYKIIQLNKGWDPFFKRS